MQETCLIIFWFFLWEWGDVFVFERKRARTARTEAAQLASMKIIFNEKFLDEPLDNDLKEQIMEELISDGEGED